MLSETEKEKILDRVAKKAGDYEESAVSCSQGTLVALQEEFSLGGRQRCYKSGWIHARDSKPERDVRGSCRGSHGIGAKIWKRKIGGT